MTSMTWRRMATVLAVWAALVTTTAVGYAWGHSQRATPPPAEPLVLSGEDVGFRMVGRQGDKVIGVIVVRVNGKWIATTSPWETKPLKQ